MQPESAAPLDASLAADHVAVEVGIPTPVTVSVRNRAPGPVDVVVRPLGGEVAGEGTRVGPLAPGQEVTATVAFTLPPRYPGQALTAAVELVAHPAGSPDVLGRTILPVELVLHDGGQVTARLVRRDLRGRYRARIRLVLDNRTDQPVEVHLGSDAPTGQVRVTLPEDPVVLAPGDGTVVDGRVATRVRLWGGVNRYPFGVLVTTRRGTQRLPANFSHRSVFARGLVRGLGVLVAFAVWGSALVAGLNYVADDRGRSDAETAQAVGGVGGPDDPGVPTVPGGPGGSGGTPGPGEGDGAGGEEPPPPPAIQVGGTITGRDIAGVTVRLESISLSEARQQGAQFTSTVRPAARRQGLTKVVGGTARRYQAVPIASVRTQVAPVARQAGAIVTSTNEDGLWGFADVRAPGFYLLTFAKAGYQTAKRVIEATEDSQGIDLKISLEAGTGSITGLVTGAGAPLGGAEVTVTDGILTYSSTTASTGEVGRYTIEGLSTPGTYLVSAARAGFGREARLVELGAGGSASDVDLGLEPGVGSVTGVISTPEGPRGGISVRVSGPDVEREATTFTEGEVGRYLLPQLPLPGTYTLRVEGEGWSTETRSVELDGNEVVNLELRRTTAQLSGNVFGPGRTPLSSAGITLESDSGETFRSVTADDGFFSMAGITPGSYVVEVESAGHARTQHLVTLVAGAPQSLDVHLEESEPDDIPLDGTITGTIANAHPGPDRPGPDCAPDTVVAAEIEVVLSTPDPRVDPAALRTTANCEDGTFAVTGLPPGVHRLVATHPNFVTQEARVRVPVSGTTEADLALVPLASLVVQVFSDSTGLRLTGAGVTARITPADPADLVARPDGSLGLERVFPTGSYELRVRAPNHREVVRALALTAGEVVEIQVRLPRMGQLTVAVYEFLSGLDVNPAPGEPVTLLGADGAPARDAAGNPITPNPRVTGPDGTVEFTGLVGARMDAPGEGQYLVRVPGRDDIPVVVTEDRAENDLVTAVLTAPQEQFRGRILWKQDLLDAGVPHAVVQARVVVGAQVGPDGNPVLTTRTYTLQADADGRFGIHWATDLPAGQPPPVSHLATLTISAPGFVTRTLTEQQIDTDQFRAELVPRPGSLTGTVQRQDLPGLFTPGSPAVTATVVSHNGATVAVTVGAGGAVTPAPAEVPPGTYEITYQQAGYDPTTVVVEVPPGGPADASAILDRRGQVTVRAWAQIGSSTLPLAGADYAIERLAAGGAFVPHATAAAVAGSSHDFGDLTAGTYRVRATRSGHVRDGAPWIEVSVPIGGTPTVEFVLRKLGSISGTTQHAFPGAPASVLSGATVRLRLNGAPDPLRTVTSSGTGAFSFEGLDPGTYDVEVTAPGHDDLDQTLSLGIGEDRALGALVLTTRPAVLEGVVRDSRTDVALNGVLVRLTAPDGSELTTTTDSEGRYRFEGLAPQQWQIALSLNGYSPLQNSLNLGASAGQTFSYAPKLVRIRNAIVGEVLGRFGPARTEPVEGATVAIARPDGSPVPGLPASTYQSGPGGAFTIADLPTGSYRLHVTAAGFADPGPNIVIVTETGDLNLVGPQAIVLDVLPVDVTVLVQSSVTAAGFSRPIATRSVSLVADPASTGSDRSATTGGDGRAAFAGVIPGTYSVVVAASGDGVRPGAEEDLVVPLAASDLDETVTVPEVGLSGTVRTDDGTGAVVDGGVTVSLMRPPGTVVASTDADGATGVYRFLAAPDVLWTVTVPVAPAGYDLVPETHPVTLAGGVVADDLDFTYVARDAVLRFAVSGPPSATFILTVGATEHDRATGAQATFTVRPGQAFLLTVEATGFVPQDVPVPAGGPGEDRPVETVTLLPVPPGPP